MATEHEIRVPGYRIDGPETTLDYDALGAIVDRALLAIHGLRPTVLRATSAAEHEGGLATLLESIRRFGTDRTETGRIGRGYESVDCDFFAWNLDLAQPPIFSKFMRTFFVNGQNPKYGGKPLRLDVITLYDPSRVQQVSYERNGKTLHDAYRFADRRPDPCAVERIIVLR